MVCSISSTSLLLSHKQILNKPYYSKATVTIDKKQLSKRIEHAFPNFETYMLNKESQRLVWEN